MNIAYKNDIQNVVAKTHYFIPFENSVFLITGATGLIGSTLIKSLLTFAKNNNSLIKIYACCRTQNKFESVFEGYLSNNLIPIYGDIKEIDISEYEFDYVIHGASITDSKQFVEKPVDTIEITIEGTLNILKKLKNKKIKSFVYLSSLEVYGVFPNTDNEIKNVTETDMGTIDCLSVRSSYSESKRTVECLCKAFQLQYGLPIKIARLSQTFGTGVSYDDNRVFAQFAKAIIEDKDIVLKTKGETVRNYCYTTDAVTGILTILQKGISGEAYNIANKDSTISIIDLAKLFIKMFPDSKTKIKFELSTDIEKLGYNPVVKIKLDSTKLERLGWTPNISLSESVRKLVEGMKNELN